jgi:nucleoside-diphosphate-sugar epimerase
MWRRWVPFDRLRTGIGGHLVKKLKREGYWVRGVDIKEHEFAETQADEFRLLDLREAHNCWECRT